MWQQQIKKDASRQKPSYSFECNHCVCSVWVSKQGAKRQKVICPDFFQKEMRCHSATSQVHASIYWIIFNMNGIFLLRQSVTQTELGSYFIVSREAFALLSQDCFPSERPLMLRLRGMLCGALIWKTQLQCYSHGQGLGFLWCCISQQWHLPLHLCPQTGCSSCGS